MVAERVAPGIYEIAGPDTLTMEEMVESIGELNGGVKPSVPLPFSSSRLEGAAAALVTDSSREVLEPLMEGLHEDLLVEENTLESVFGVSPTPVPPRRGGSARTAARRGLKCPSGPPTVAT